MKTNKILAAIVLAATITTTSAFVGGKENTYKVNNDRSDLTWVGKKVTGEHTGKVSVKEGKLLVDGKTIKGGTVDVDMNSITCTDLTDATWNAKLVGHLKSKDFFFNESFPTAKFEITSVTEKGDGHEVKGKLTIKGITKEISFPASVKFEGKTVAVVGTATVDRTQFDIKYGSANFFENLGDKAISNDFKLEFKIIATM